jgi:hypothetical protein
MRCRVKPGEVDWLRERVDREENSGDLLANRIFDNAEPFKGANCILSKRAGHFIGSMVESRFREKRPYDVDAVGRVVKRTQLVFDDPRRTGSPRPFERGARGAKRALVVERRSVYENLGHCFSPDI